MAIWELWSKRQEKKRKQGQEDVFQYDDLPQPFRAQIVHIWRDSLGEWRDLGRFSAPMSYTPNDWWNEIFCLFTREKGVFHLGSECDPCRQCFAFVNKVARDLAPHYRRDYGIKVSPDEAISELNARFREHGIGYEFVDGELIRVDSKYIHAEAVRPAIALMHSEGKWFAGPLEEFMQAHEHYRKNEEKDAISWALKAFESTMKAICSAKGWVFDPHRDTAAKLINVLFSNELIPSYLQNEFTGLRTVLEAGVPTVRNKTSGHGQGATPVKVPEHLTRYVLHLTASNIVLLIDSFKAMT